MARSSAVRRPTPTPEPSPRSGQPSRANRLHATPASPAAEEPPAIGSELRRGRGALSNQPGRYEPLARIAFDDGWQSLEDLPPFSTTVTPDATRKIITRHDSPD